TRWPRDWSSDVCSSDLDRLKASQRSTLESDGIRTIFSDYKYDALGRRVLVRTRWDQYCQGFAPRCLSTIERTVWDGDQILAELRSEEHTSELQSRGHLV